MEDYSRLFMLFLMYSFLGWLLECFNTFKNHKKFVNRGFLIGPICPIYGIGCILMILTLSKHLENPFSLFCSAVVICSALEYFTSYIMEKLFSARWWDYSNKKYNVEGRICLKFSLGFGVLGTLIMYFINPFFMDTLLKINDNTVNMISCILCLILIIDFVISFKTILGIKGSLISNSKDNTEEISKKVKEIVKNKSILHRRIMNAFPDTRLTRKIKAKKNK